MTTRGYTTEEGDRLNNFAVEPTVYVDDTQRTGFTEFAEKLNGRLAMIGFVSALLLEISTGHGVVGWLTSL
ncbi:MAG: high light inducible protein [Pleurocapsa sp. CRU_1_2]|nr:high light inducible protein [Pleurocapsa sp. CRU_1_2]